ncbi:hypothetical protein AB205_0081310 [Aquarana catesbeiana]|uniref:Uncharacterized protein n=1 Tax=Aquarana catesbeiana TaxID=8400 RepID=A0A2G9S2G8_AQUCT|nr:hypothetical protein AB205_0081310 [Aquarana catesbeiana]
MFLLFIVVHHQTSQSVRRTLKIMRQKQCRKVSKPQEGEGQSQSVDDTARPRARPSSLQRSVHVSHDRQTTSRSLRHGKKPKNPEMDKAMKSFMDEMTSFKRQESKDPFCDPNNSNTSFLGTICHTLQKAPAERQMEIHMGIFNYVGDVLELLSQECHCPLLASMNPLRGHTVNIPMIPHAFQPSHIYRPIHRPLCVHTAQCTIPRCLLMLPLLLIPHREHILRV